MRRRQAEQGQYGPWATMTASRAGAVAQRHVHVPAATGQGRLRERLRGPETAIRAHVRPRAHARQETGAEQALRAAHRHTQVPGDSRGRVPTTTGTVAHASSATTAAAGARARPRRTATGDGRRGRVLAPTRPPRLAPDAASGTQRQPAAGTPKRLSEPLRQRLRRRIPRLPARARTVRRDAPEGLGTGPQGRTEPCDAWLLERPRSVCSREGLTSVFAGGFDGCQRR